MSKVDLGSDFSTAKQKVTLMITLREMRKDEFANYCNYFIDDYSHEIVANYGHAMDVAIEMAKQDLNKSFPNGLEKNAHDLFCIDAKLEGNNSLPTLVGYLWFSINVDDNSAFIYDFYVYEAFRGQGFGKLAMSALETRLQSIKITQIKLRVAYQNKRALKLYQDAGFNITGINMSKILSM
ncbi:GNAT family N-acetyltransferase [Marinomonas sp. 15G1-11]|uniref:GNAT family N-acetyltransferase n=1 Tax=Marinomonas phaeophyticola TaxID=3004091 RepID=A0ABT4JQJ7_9GAMM|nr:GNAT family N-acetyltransferase [Marinomonas sp. 15G1-11]MCZ2720635.1 GNAT family N-acetyltransferase [Marinomonas sp. 15G1-11]